MTKLDLDELAYIPGIFKMDPAPYAHNDYTPLLDGRWCQVSFSTDDLVSVIDIADTRTGGKYFSKIISTYRWATRRKRYARFHAEHVPLYGDTAVRLYVRLLTWDERWDVARYER